MKPYLVAVLIFMVAVLTRWLLDPRLADDPPSGTVYVAVAVGEYIVGYRSTILAAISRFLASSYLFVEPRWSAWPHGTAQWISLATCLFSCGIIIGLGEALHTAPRRAMRERLKVMAERERFRPPTDAVNGIICE